MLSDSNSRVQAVIDGQGIALWDILVDPEVRSGQLVYVSDIWLDDYGYYLVYPKEARDNPVVTAFKQWINDEAHGAHAI